MNYALEKDLKDLEKRVAALEPVQTEPYVADTVDADKDSEEEKKEE